MPKNKKSAQIERNVFGYFLRQRGLYLMKATILAQELFNDEIKVENWMMTTNSYFSGDSPFKVILQGNGAEIIRFLEERLGRRSGTGF